MQRGHPAGRPRQEEGRAAARLLRGHRPRDAAARQAHPHDRHRDLCRRGRHGETQKGSGRNHRLPAQSQDVYPPGRQDTARRAAGGPSRLGQDAAGQGRCRRGQRAFLLDLGSRVPRRVYGLGREPRARALPQCQGEGSLHHLHRRDRRHRQPLQPQRRARNHAQPAAGRDGRLWHQLGRDRDGRHQSCGAHRQGPGAPWPLRPQDICGLPRAQGPRGDF